MSAPTGGGYYPQEPYYAPGWTGPAAPVPPRRRRTALVVVLVLVGVLVLGLAAWGAVVLRQGMQTRLLGEVDRPTTAHSRQLDVGHCLATLPADGTVDRVDLVPCADPHVAEVVGVHPFRSDEWPGQDAVDDESAAACEMDAAQAAAGFRAVVWSPSQESWAQGDRRGLCLAWLPDGEARGSFAAGDEVTTG